MLMIFSHTRIGILKKSYSLITIMTQIISTFQNNYRINPCLRAVKTNLLTTSLGSYIFELI